MRFHVSFSLESRCLGKVWTLDSESKDDVGLKEMYIDKGALERARRDARQCPFQAPSNPVFRRRLWTLHRGARARNEP